MNLFQLRAFDAVVREGSFTRTFCSPTGISSRIGPFIIIGFVRLTRWTVIESFCRHSVTSITPRPVTATGAGSLVAQVTALRSNLPWSRSRISQNVRSISQGK